MNATKDLTLQQAQEKVDEWIKTVGVRYFSELTNMAILTEETGELARIIARKYGDQSFKETDILPAQKNCQAARRNHGAAPGEAAVVFNVFVTRNISDQTDNQKRADIHDQINNDVKQNRRQPVVVQHRQPHHHIAGVCNPGVSQHALEIALVQGAEIADGHRDHAEEQQDLGPFDS